MRKTLALLLCFVASPALADWTGKDATGTTITFKNPNVCSSVVCVPISSLVDATGAAVGTVGAPLRIDPTGATTQPVSAAASALAVGSGTDGWNATEGTKADTACANSGSTCSISASLKGILGGVQGSIPAGTNVVGFTSSDPCSQTAKSNFAIASSTGNTQLVAGVSAKKVFICSIFVTAATAAVVNVIEGTGAACTTANEAAVIGSTTAANGMSFSANSGWAQGNGGSTIGVTATAANGICLLQSGTAALAGNITFVQQ